MPLSRQFYSALIYGFPLLYPSTGGFHSVLCTSPTPLYLWSLLLRLSRQISPCSIYRHQRPYLWSLLSYPSPGKSTPIPLHMIAFVMPPSASSICSIHVSNTPTCVSFCYAPLPAFSLGSIYITSVPTMVAFVLPFPGNFAP